MKIKGKNAISLIVLVITILVLSILAATVIISISNTNVISEASKTTFKSDMASYKEAYEMYVASELAKNAEFDRTTLNLTYQDDEFSKIFGTVSERYKEGLKVVDGVLVYESEDETENEVLNEVGMIPKISKKKSYVGYFADVDGNGTVDGVIFADLCISGYGEVSQVSESTVKDYKITQESYTVPNAAGYGTHPVLTAIGSGEDRFYVMALSDKYSGISWLDAEVVSNFDGELNLHSYFGSGKSNTEYMVTEWGNHYGGPDVSDLWSELYYQAIGGGLVPFDMNNLQGWFVPSLEEWDVFDKNIVGSSVDFDSFGLYSINWTSSLVSGSGAHVCLFQDEHYHGTGVVSWSCTNKASVRMARTY